MANVTIPNLTSATTIAPSTDLMVLEQTEGTRKATLSQIFTDSATSGSGLGITSGGVYTIKSGLDSDISDINTLLGSTSIASIGDGTVTGAVSQINSDLTVNILGEKVKPILNSEFTFNFTDGVATKDMSQFLESGYHFAKACFVTHTAGTYFVLNSASINPATNTLTVRASAIRAQTGVVDKFNGTAILGVLFFLTRNA